MDPRGKLALVSLTALLCAICLFTSTAGQQPEVPDYCIGCICHASTNCNKSASCSGEFCGPFLISWAYWADAGKFVLAGDHPDGPTAYVNCVTSFECATETIRAYMAKYKQDCNGDGVVNCEDYNRIHKQGGFGCKGPGIEQTKYYAKFQRCMSTVGPRK